VVREAMPTIGTYCLAAKRYGWPFQLAWLFIGIDRKT
jgi:hypothetical protein